MKILYAIQGTGNGHLSRAKDIVPLLKERAEVDVLVSGIQADVEFPFQVDYKLHGVSFIFGKKGGVDFWNTFKKNFLRRIFKEYRQLNLKKYDLVINDFEPISAWKAFFTNAKIVSLSHQIALSSSLVPKPEHRDFVGQLLLKYYAPAKDKIGFHFKKYEDFIFTPVIRKEIRELNPTNQGHYTVYLPAYSDKKIIKVLSEIPGVDWEVFSKHTTQDYIIRNVRVRKINNTKFIKSLEACEGLLCGAGFEAPAEALFLGKKLCVIPMKGQYEQHYNAMALKEMGIPVLKKLGLKRVETLQLWTESNFTVPVNYPNQTSFIIDDLLAKYSSSTSRSNPIEKTALQQEF